MKKIFFFLLLLFLPVIVSASSIKELKVLNGILSREFESTNNKYSVILNENEDQLKLEYKLKDTAAEVKIINNEYNEESENKAILEITNSDGTKEEYVFYLEKENTKAVFNESNLVNTANIKKQEIPYLIWYVATGCLCIILLLFKIIVLGFKKKTKTR